MSIVIVEDEQRVLNFLTEALRKEGYVVHPIDNYEGAVTLLDSLGDQAQVLVLDRLLHRTDAITLISKAKVCCPQIRIIVLSTINSPAQKAAALDLGADDYLGKPFSLVELSARIRSLSRRQEGGRAAHENYTFTVRDLSVNALDHKVSVDGKSIDLSNKEYLLLLTLVQHPGRVYNKFQLLDKVWDTQFDIESNVVEVTIKNLRKKLVAAGSKSEILSRRNIGYWIET
jgi:DNA-binding response OmpR family regulator